MKRPSKHKLLRFIFGLAVTLVFLAGGAAHVNSSCNLNLPGLIKMTVDVNEYEACETLLNFTSYLSATLTDVPSGSSVPAGTYGGFCADLTGYILDKDLFGSVEYQVQLFSSLDQPLPDSLSQVTSPLPPDGTGITYPIPWDKINYILNKYPIPANSWLDVQAAIWSLIHGCAPQSNGQFFDCSPEMTAPDYFPYGSSDAGCPGIVNKAKVKTIFEDADVNGCGFTPGSDEFFALIVQVETCSGAIGNYCNALKQVVFIPAQCPTPGIAVTKECTDAPAPGQPINFSAVITNTGNETLKTITCSDDKADALNVSVPSLAPGTSTTVTGSYVPTGSPSTDTLTCSGTGAISNAVVSNSDSATCKINTVPAITVTKSCTDASAPGQPINFSAIVKNTGNETLSGITCSDSPATTLSGVPASLAPGTSATVTGSYVPTGSPSTDTLTCSGMGAISSKSISSSGSATCTVNPWRPDITIVKTADKQTVLLGEKVTFTYKITNSGNLALTNVKVVDDNGTPTYTSDDFTVGTIALLAPGASQTFTSTRVPPAPMCGGGEGGGCGLLVTEHRNDGKTKFTFLQSKDGRDNYRTFNNWYGSRAYSHKAKIRVYDKNGNPFPEVGATLGNGDGSKYFNSFSCLADKSTVVKSDGCSVNLPEIFYKKGWNKDWRLDWDQSRGDDNRYHCWDDDYEGYNGTWDHNEHPDTCSGTSTNTATVTASWSGGTISATDDATVNLIAEAASKVSITKTVNKGQAAPGEAVTYTYVVTNTGGGSLTNLVIVDDNGTPTITADDFTVGTVALLDPSKSTTLTKTLVPAAPVCDGSSGCGLMITQHLNNGTTKFTFLQSKDERDTYRTFYGWEGRRSYAHRSKMRVYDKTGWTYQDFNSTPSAGAGSNYFNSFNVVVNTSSVVKSDGCSVNLPTVFYKTGWNNDWRYDWDKSVGDYNRAHYWDDDYSGHFPGWDYNTHPYSCSGTVTNTAKVTATGETATVTASDDATVKIVK